MNIKNWIVAAGVGLAAVSMADTAQAQRPIERIFSQSMATRGDMWAQGYANSRPWHGNYYNINYNHPVAVVVPPNAVMQQNYSWGTSRNTSTPVYHQFGYQLNPSFGGPFYATPPWPSHTGQFGYYPVRAPW